MNKLIKVSILDEFVDNLNEKFGLVLKCFVGVIDPDFSNIPPTVKGTDPTSKNASFKYFFEITCSDDSLKVVNTLIKKIRDFTKIADNSYKNSTLVWRIKPEISRYYNYDEEKIIYGGYARLLILKGE